MLFFGVLGFQSFGSGLQGFDVSGITCAETD